MKFEGLSEKHWESIRLLAGSREPEDTPWELFSPPVLDFLSALSGRIRLLSRKKAGEELKSLGFWLRRSRLLTFREQYPEAGRLGLGLSFHIAPANVPLMFAYSLAIGLMAGDSCLVRVSSRQNHDAGLLCSLMDRLLNEDGFQSMKQRISIVSYDSRETAVTEAFSRSCDARIIWGGDQTVDTIRRIPLKPTAAELVFPNRYSIALIRAEAVLALTDEDLGNLAVRFYNDTYAMDQNACSCPRLVFWQEERRENGRQAAGRFWDAVAQAAERYELSGIKVSEKYGNLWELAGENALSAKFSCWKNRLYVLTAQRPLEAGAIPLLRFGSFLEYHMDDNAQWIGALSEKVQTLTYFGVSPDSLRDAVFQSRKKGVDRIVPVGQALSMDLAWDGKDLIRCLSKSVHCAAERSLR